MRSIIADLNAQKDHLVKMDYVRNVQEDVQLVSLKHKELKSLLTVNHVLKISLWLIPLIESKSVYGNAMLMSLLKRLSNTSNLKMEVLVLILKTKNH
jgi:hypothetical protein